MADIQKIVLDRFHNLYGEPKRPEPEKFYAEYERALMGWSEDILAKAVDQVIATHPHNWWPMPGTVTKACREIAPAPRIVDTDTKFTGRENMTPDQIDYWEGEMKSFREIMKEVEKRMLQRRKDGVVEFDRCQRPAFERMQRRSAMPEHRKLTALSRRMTGERD